LKSPKAAALTILSGIKGKPLKKLPTKKKTSPPYNFSPLTIDR